MNLWSTLCPERPRLFGIPTAVLMLRWALSAEQIGLVEAEEGAAVSNSSSCPNCRPVTEACVPLMLRGLLPASTGGWSIGDSG